MTHEYIEVDFKIDPVYPGSEIVMAELGQIGFDSFVETDNGLLAYILKTNWDTSILKKLSVFENSLFSIHYTYKEIVPVNWNEEWEKNFNPIIVDKKCTVRAPFHDAANTQYDIVIEPKMSFGTGHHETTYLMIQQLLEVELTSKKALDMGCGTGVLAILAEMRGASYVDAIDIDEWCYLNTKENVERNACTAINCFQGDALLLKDQKYDLIIANINRNILIRDIPIYASCLNDKGILLLSGFYEDDFNSIHNTCTMQALNFIEKKEKNSWISLKYIN